MTQHIINFIQPMVNKLSRRRALIWLGGSGITTTLVVGSSNMVKADNTPKPKVVQKWLDAQNSVNPLALAALYTDNGILEDVPNNFSAQGRTNIQCFAQSVEQKLSGIKLEVKNSLSGQNQATIEGDSLYSAISAQF